MPIKRKPGESKNDFISRCIAEEIRSGKDNDQAAAICYDVVNLAPIKVSFDFDGVLTSAKGRELLKKHMEAGDNVFVITARHHTAVIRQYTDAWGIPISHVFATSSNLLKIKLLRKLKMDKHYDDNLYTVANLPNVAELFSYENYFK